MRQAEALFVALVEAMHSRAFALLAELESVREDADDERIARGLQRLREAIERVADGAVRRHLEDIARDLAMHADRELSRALSGTSHPVTAEGVEALLEAYVEENVARIKKLADAQIAAVSRATKEIATLKLRGPEAEKRLRERTQPVTSRAKLAARDQALKTNAKLTKQKHQSAGIERYRWITSRDERVRESHRELDGKEFSWDDPPIVDGVPAHPGEPPLCRCTASPVLEGVPTGPELARSLPDRPPPAPVRKPRRTTATERAREKLSNRLTRAVASLKRKKPPGRPTLTVKIDGKPRKVRLNPLQRDADSTSLWLQRDPFAREHATYEERRTWMQWQWVHDSRRKTSALMQAAAKREFGLRGKVWSGNRKFRHKERDLSRTARDMRRMREETLADFRRRGVKSLPLYRGIQDPSVSASGNALSSWSTDRDVAVDFAGRTGIVVKEEIPVERILTHSGTTGWVEGAAGPQREYIVLSE